VAGDEPSESTRGPDPPRRSERFGLLVVAAETVVGEELRNAVAQRAQGRDVAVRVVAPALTETKFQHAAGAIDDAREQAQERLDRSLKELSAAGIEASGEVGDSDLKLAIEDALRAFAADEVLIVAHKDDPPPLEREGIAEAERSVDAKITELYVTGDGNRPQIAEVEEIAAGGDREAAREEIHGQSRNLPRYGAIDLAGIAVAIIGTGILVVLAANCGGDTTLNTQGGFGDESGFGGCEIRVLIAGALGLVNVAHVVGLMLFQSGPYEGFWRPFFARLSLIGTPLAIVVSALLG
jgi:hypothetical protein